MVQIKVRIAQRMDEIARTQSALLRDHHRQQRVRSDVERYAQKRIGAPLVKLTRKAPSGHVKLKQHMAGRQQLALKRTIGENILRTGYCVTPKLVKPELHPEQGTVWEWIYENDEEIYGQFSAAYNRPGAGALRKLDDRSMEELHRIFDVTGGKEFFDTIEKHSDRKAREMGYDGADDEYMMYTYTKNSNEHY